VTANPQRRPLGRKTQKNRPFGLLRKLSVSDIGIKPMAGFSAFIWSNLCTRYILSELTPRGHQYWPDKRATRGIALLEER
jgi:hypothetical protein